MKREEKPNVDRTGRRATIRDGIHAAVVLGGWCLFFYWWYLVLPRTRPTDALFAGLAILAVFLGTLAATLAWIRYNLGIYRRKGPRLRNPDVPERYTADTLGRELVHPGWEVLRASPHITVTVEDGNRKRYSAERS